MMTVIWSFWRAISPARSIPPKGCKFHTRCKYCTDICKIVTPEMEEVRPNHFVACHHILKDNL